MFTCLYACWGRRSSVADYLQFAMALFNITWAEREMSFMSWLQQNYYSTRCACGQMSKERMSFTWEAGSALAKTHCLTSSLGFLVVCTTSQPGAGLSRPIYTLRCAAQRAHGTGEIT